VELLISNTTSYAIKGGLYFISDKENQENLEHRKRRQLKMQKRD